MPSRNVKNNHDMKQNASNQYFYKRTREFKYETFKLVLPPCNKPDL